MENINKKFHQRLKSRRTEMNLTQKELAAKVHSTRSTIAGYEAMKNPKEPDLSTLGKIAEALDCTTDYLLGRTKHPNELLPDNYSDSLTKEELEFAKKEGIVFVVVPEKVAQRLTVEKVKGFIQDIKSSQE